MYTLIGQVADTRGLSVQHGTNGDISSSFALPASGYLEHQPPDIGLFFSHDESWRVGSCQYLERSADHGLVVVAEVVDSAVEHMRGDEDGQWFLSPGAVARHRGDGLYGKDLDKASIHEISLVRAPAAINRCQPVKWWRSDGGAAGYLPLNWYGTVDRAREAVTDRRYRSAASFMPVVDIDPVAAVVAAPPPVPRVVAPPPARQRKSLLRWNGRDIFDEGEAERLMRSAGYEFFESAGGRRSWGKV